MSVEHLLGDPRALRRLDRALVNAYYAMRGQEVVWIDPKEVPTPSRDAPSLSSLGLGVHYEAAAAQMRDRSSAPLALRSSTNCSWDEAPKDA